MSDRENCKHSKNLLQTISINIRFSKTNKISFEQNLMSYVEWIKNYFCFLIQKKEPKEITKFHKRMSTMYANFYKQQTRAILNFFHIVTKIGFCVFFLNNKTKKYVQYYCWRSQFLLFHYKLVFHVWYETIYKHKNNNNKFYLKISI